MTTKAEFIAQLKIENPVIREGNEADGYREFTAREYDAQISAWADKLIADEIATTQADAEKAAILAKIGITADELKIATA